MSDPQLSLVLQSFRDGSSHTSRPFTPPAFLHPFTFFPLFFLHSLICVALLACFAPSLKKSTHLGVSVVGGAGEEVLPF